MVTFIRKNSLSIVFLLLFIISITGQVITGWREYNNEMLEEKNAPVSLASYLSTGHFIEATFENWESEFLQMALFVILTIFLRQKGSSESKGFEGKEEVDREPSPRRKGAPAIVKKGGWVLTIYKYSLSIALMLLFLVSFALHLYGSLADENQQLANKGLPPESVTHYLAGSRFWFESFQNWQSEFLSVFALVVLSIFLRQKRFTAVKTGRCTQ